MVTRTITITVTAKERDQVDRAMNYLTFVATNLQYAEVDIELQPMIEETS